MPSFTKRLTPLRLEEIVPRPKEVHRARGYQDMLRLSRMDPIYSDDLAEAVERMENGHALSARFYRKRKGLDKDETLELHGIMHLHLGGQDSNVLLFLYQLPRDVILLQINNHDPFETKPPGVILHQRYSKALAIWQAEQEVRLSNVNRHMRQLLRIPSEP